MAANTASPESKDAVLNKSVEVENNSLVGARLLVACGSVLREYVVIEEDGNEMEVPEPAPGDIEPLEPAEQIRQIELPEPAPGDRGEMAPTPVDRGPVNRGEMAPAPVDPEEIPIVSGT